MSRLTVGSLEGLSENSNVISVPAGHKLNVADAGALSAPGHILQVVSTTKTDTFSASVNNGGNVAVTGLTATITPSSTSSKILVMATLTASQETEYASSLAILTRGGTAIGGGDAASLRTPISGGTTARMTNGNDIAQATVLYLDSPSSTSALTYGINILCSAGSLRTIYVNRSVVDGNVEERPRSSSTITVMEVAG